MLSRVSSVSEKSGQPSSPPLHSVADGFSKTQAMGAETVEPGLRERERLISPTPTFVDPAAILFLMAMSDTDEVSHSPPDISTGSRFSRDMAAYTPRRPAGIWADTVIPLSHGLLDSSSVAKKNTTTVAGREFITVDGQCIHTASHSVSGRTDGQLAFPPEHIQN
ncbi:hypothetical protein MJO29_015098 [Puccinia striiformis f. sp. tritici]|nr:hypothetical protein MJO29_015098 [Puccinia striiformis f. sp. tritici]